LKKIKNIFICYSLEIEKPVFFIKLFTVKENVPNPSKNVSQEPSYPYSVIRINSKKTLVFK